MRLTYLPAAAAACIVLLSLALSVGAADEPQFSSLSETLPPAPNHPAIDYFRSSTQDPVALLNADLDRGTAALEYQTRAGYLKSVLDALKIPVESQLLVFSRTSLQVERISPQNPRGIYFNDSVAVAWMYSGFIEVASQDPRQGVIFYTLTQDPVERSPRFVRTDNCLRCHQSEVSLGVPGLMERSVYTAPNGDVMLLYGGTFPDHRTPFRERWGGWYVTGAGGGFEHLGNTMLEDRAGASRDPSKIVTPQTLARESLEGQFPMDRYLSLHSDAAALLVFDHQMHMMNLITRIGWDARAAAHDQTPDADRRLRDAAREVVDYMLFVEEQPLRTAGFRKVGGASGFPASFAAQGPWDSRGRTLREMDLETRTFRYPCSFMIYSPAFAELPAAATAAIYQRLSEVLSGQAETGGGPQDAARYGRLTDGDRRAIVEILRDTKPDIRGYLK